MPFIQINMIENRTPNEIKTLLDASQRALVAAFKVPEHEHYQVLYEHPPPL